MSSIARKFTVLERELARAIQNGHQLRARRALDALTRLGMAKGSADPIWNKLRVLHDSAMERFPTLFADCEW